MKIFLYSTYPFLLEPPFQSIQSPFSQSQFFLFWKIKVKHTGVDIMCFFQDAKVCFGSVLWNQSHIKVVTFIKKVNFLQLKTISAKKTKHLRCLGRSKRIPAFTLMNPNPNINTSTISKDSMQNTSTLFNNSPTSPYNLVTENTDI